MASTINDGFTITTTIKGRGFVPDLEVTYRPALAARIYQWRRDGAATRTGDEEFANDVKLITERVNVLGNGLPVTPEGLAGLWPWQLAELLNLVCGYAVPETRGQPSRQQDSEKN